VDYCGKKIQADSYGETLEALLTRLEIPTDGDYVVSQPLSAETYNGMQVTVNRVLEMRQTYTEDIPYETVECYDPTLPEGTSYVKVEGVNGQVRKTANVVYVNSEQTGSTVLEETVAQQPVNKIVVVGTGTEVDEKSKAPAIGNGVIVTADGQVLTYSRKENFRATAYTHTDAGCDMITATGTKVRVGAIAVDPKLIPYGTRMFIVSNDGKYVYGIATAEDCGGGIKGDQVDLYFPTTKECFQFGKRRVSIYFLD
jgi:3D (Asp-Asp-Asp) domain-containing protein